MLSKLFKPIRLIQVITLFISAFVLCVSISWSGMAGAIATPLTLVPNHQMTTTSPDIPDVDPEKGAQQAEKASDDIFTGLDTTKELIGKTPGRKQAIQHAREHASQKLQGLADKAEHNEDSLNAIDKTVLDHISK